MNLSQIDKEFKRLERLELFEQFKYEPKLSKQNNVLNQLQLQIKSDNNNFMQEFESEMQILGLTPSMQRKKLKINILS